MQLNLLRDLAITSFTDTYGDFNEPDNFKNYISESFSLQKLEQELNAQGSFFYVVYIGEQEAGYIKINIGDDQTVEGQVEGMEIERIYVLNRFKRRGIGRLLIDFAQVEARRHDKKYLWLGVWEKNTDAIKVL